VSGEVFWAQLVEIRVFLSPTGYSLRFKTKVTFGHNLRYKTKGTFGEISFKVRQTNWNVAINNVDVVADELPSQSTNNLHIFNN
jgi:hypothetical protein